MQKLMIALLILLSVQVNAQIKEGFIKFQVKMESNHSSERFNPMSGNSEAKVYFKNDKSLSEITTPVFTIKTLIDSKRILTITDGVGQKMYFQKTKEAIEADKKNGKFKEPVITYTKEKKKVAGYECTKALITVTSNSGKALSMIMWVTDKLPNIPGIGPTNINMPVGLKGMALEVDTNQGPIHTTMTATEISTKPVPDAVFVVSTAGYTEMKLPGTPKPVK